MRLLTLGAAIALVWALVCAWYYFRQEAVLFHPSRLSPQHEFQFDRPFEEHRIEVEPGVELSALLFEADVSTGESTGPRRAVLYLHGNAGDLQSWGWHADLYAEAGYDFIAIDYRGYGKSDGRIRSEAELHADIEHTWEWVERRYDPGHVIVIGYSLGSALAAPVACRHEAAGLVLLAPFSSVSALARRAVPFVPMSVLRYPLRTDRVLADCRVPVTIFHGLGDRTIPFSESERLMKILGSRGRLVALSAAGHQDIADDPTFQREMRELLAAEAAEILARLQHRR